MTTIRTKKIVLVGGMYMCGVCECVKKRKKFFTVLKRLKKINALVIVNSFE